MRYLFLLLKHKWYVFVAGRYVKCPLRRLITHDLSKFTFSEYKHYQRQFCGPHDDPEGFARAWLHHQNRNDHHWEYWIPRTGHHTIGCAEQDPIDMPVGAVKEMMADWLGAGKAYNGKWPVKLNKDIYDCIGRIGMESEWEWLSKNWSKISSNVSKTTLLRIKVELFMLNVLTPLERQEF